MQIRAAVGFKLKYFIIRLYSDNPFDVPYVLHTVSGDIASTVSVLHVSTLTSCDLHNFNRNPKVINPASCAESGMCVFVNLVLCFSVREKGAEDCKDLIDAFQACIKTLSEGS